MRIVRETIPGSFANTMSDIACGPGDTRGGMAAGLACFACDAVGSIQHAVDAVDNALPTPAALSFRPQASRTLASSRPRANGRLAFNEGS
jgi:hypothetical protein